MKPNLSNKSGAYRIGVDLGGTTIHAGIVYTNGKIGAQTYTCPTEAEKNRKSVLQNMVGAINGAIEKNKLNSDLLQGIGIGSPGPLDLRKGRILDPINVPSLNYFNIRSYFKRHFGVRVEVNNDANCFALSEAHFGAGKKARVTIGLTLGTGLGCGIVFGKELYNGCTGTAAEVWNTPYRHNTFEDHISIRGVLKLAGNPKTKTPLDIATLARSGNKKYQFVWKKFGHHLGIFIANVVNLLDPDVIVPGGSMSQSFDLFEKSLRDAVNPNINKFPRENIRIVPSSLGRMAGILGAAALIT